MTQLSHPPRQLATKLAWFVTLGVTLAVLAVAVNFDAFLRQNFLDMTRTRMQHAYERLDFNLKNQAQEMKDAVAFAAKEEPMIASVELVNRYQDKANYNAALIDEEKKTLAQEMLERVKFSLNTEMVVYDQNDELLAFARREPAGFQLGYVSFTGGRAQLFTRLESEREFVPNAASGALALAQNHVGRAPHEQTSLTGLITYLRRGDDLVVRSHQNVVDPGTQKQLAHLELAYVLNSAFFARFAKDMNLSLVYSFDSPLAAQALLLDERRNRDALVVSEAANQYLGVMQQNTLDGPVYFTVTADKSQENALINAQRLKFFLILMAVAAMVLLMMRWALKRGLAQPLEQLMVQIRQIKLGNYTAVAAPHTGDELEEIGNSVNALADTVAQREAALERSRREEQHQATHDTLTGLPNRRLFAQGIDEALELAQRTGSRMALVFLDLDQFKVVNDTLGHAVGDQLLAAIAQRLQSQKYPGHTLARIGGDEFTVLIDRVESDLELTQQVQAYLELFHAPFVMDAHQINTTASIGVALYPQDGLDRATLLRAADLALYKSKDRGRDTYSFCSADLFQQVQLRADTVEALQHAIQAENEFVLYYQPKVSVVTGQVVSAEALIRWQRPGFGLVPPLSFIAVAEESGLIAPMGDWVIGQACADLARLNAQGIVLNHLSLNVSNVQLHHHDVCAVLLRGTERHALQASQLEVEITESYVVQDTQQAVASLHTLRQCGFQLAIDDFGTGYSSLSYLKKLPFTRLKIDKSFVDGLPAEPDSVAVTLAIIGLAKNFGLQVTAEGVERPDQLAFLKQAQCDEIQGYVYAKPMPLTDFVAYCQVQHFE